MIRYCVFLSIILAYNKPVCQIKGDYIWQLGFGSDILFDPYATSIEFLFDSSHLEIDTFFRAMTMGDLNASYSDDNGNLLLYTNGCEIRNGNHQYIEDSNNLSPGDVNNEWCLQEKIGYPVFDGGLLLPIDNNDTIYLLHQREVVGGPPVTVFINALYYTSLHRFNDEYIITEKSAIIFEDSLFNGNLEAVKRINGGWWILQSKRNSNLIYTIGLGSTGLDTTFSQSVGEIVYGAGSSGQSSFSPDGIKYARYTPEDDLSLFDFDRSTGLLSNFQKVHVADSGNIGGIAFSGSGRFLYVCTRLDMYQFDIWSKDIESSKVHLGHYDGFHDPFSTTFFHMQLGPDCRIYVIPPNGSSSMHIIHDPEVKGLDCRFEQHSLHLPVGNTISLPNFPNYRLDLAPPCDPDIKSGFFQFYVPPTPVDVYPNPTDGALWIHFSDAWANGGAVHVDIVDQIGRSWIKKTISIGQYNFQIDLDDLPVGIYFVQLQSDRHWFVGKVTKM